MQTVQSLSDGVAKMFVKQCCKHHGSVICSYFCVLQIVKEQHQIVVCQWGQSESIERILSSHQCEPASITLWFGQVQYDSQ
jgi:hypothetical protein